MDMELKPKFVVGIGSQRAGSTLLHNLLAISTDVFMHPLKELHYFDTYHNIRPRNVLVDFSLQQIGREIDDLVASDNLDFINEYYKCYLRANRMLGMMPIESIDYLDLFNPCLSGRQYVGEITPEYMLLPDEAIRDMHAKIGADAVIILLCRDPVDRVLSTVKLENVYNRLGFQGNDAEEWLRENLESNSEWMQAQDGFNNYRSAVDRYSKYFEKVISISYEKLVKSPQLIAKQIEKESAIPVRSNDFEKGIQETFNSLGGELEFSAEVIDLLKARYAESAEFIREMNI